jgi:hypothetical protein
MKMELELVLIKITNNTVKYHGEEIRDMYISKAFLDQPYPEKITVSIK